MNFLLAFFFVCITTASFSQKVDSFINVSEAERIISILASDSLKGRANFSQEIEKAALFIASEFKKGRLQTFQQYSAGLQPFLVLDKPEPLERVVLNDLRLRTDEYVFISPYRFPPSRVLKDFDQKWFSDDVTFEAINDSLQKWEDIDHPILLLLPKQRELLKRFSSDLQQNDIRLIIEQPEQLEQLSVFFRPELRKNMLFNVLGFLPGKTRPGELVLVTAHYDHVGSERNQMQDSVFNGANDNASGTAAMMMLANYFAAKRDNERSILFVAFAGEEVGLIGSKNLSAGLNADSIVAVVNLEMLGKPPAKEKYSCMVTGYGDLPDMFRKKARKMSVRIREDRFPTQNLFTRSDNYPFALKGIPAHTFMMFIENDPDYHQLTDEITTLDLENMTEVVKGLAGGIEELVSGKFTPKRLGKL